MPKLIFLDLSKEMNMLRKISLMIMLLALAAFSMAQTVFYSESMGTVSGTTTIAAHETADGFDVDSATYSGTADLRTTTASTGYEGASGSANVFITNTVGRYLLIEGIDSSAYSSITMALGHFKSNTTGSNELTIEVSDDGTTWTALTYSRPTGAGTASWILINPAGSIPSTSNLRIKFTQTSSTTQFRIDDLKLSGFSGTPTPTITAVGTLNPFSTYTGTPSAAQSYTLSGSNLTANIDVAAPAGYQISSNGTDYSSSLSLASTYNGLVYVRLTGAEAGTFDGNITHTSGSATQVDKAVSGTVTDPSPMINVTGTLNPFSAEVGTPSASQSYTLSGAFLTANIIVTPPAGFELSTDNASFQSSLSLASSFSGLVYVRLIGTTVGDYSGNITHASVGATQVDLSVAGTVAEPVSPTIFWEENFAYTVGTTVSSNGWIAHSGVGTDSPLVDATNLSYSSYPPVLGGSARTTGVTGEDVSKNFGQQASGDIYVSWLMNITGLPSTTQDYNFHLGDAAVQTGGTTFRGRLYVQRNAENLVRFGISKGSTNTTIIQFTDYLYAYNTTYLMVMKYKIVDGTANDEVYLWINPTIGATEPAHTLFIGTVDTTSDPSNIAIVAIRQSDKTPAAYYDGIRVTNDWAKLWEEPATPVIITTGTPDPVYNIVGNPSAEVSSYTLSGTDLQGPINIVAPTHFEISTDALTGYATTLQVPASFNGLIYVRMISSVVGEHAGDITHNSAGADEVLVRVEGETFPADVTWNITQSLTPFTQEAGTASPAQSYTLSATNATGNIAVSVDEPFELSTSSTGPWSASLDLLSSFNGSVYVRMNSATAGSFNKTIVHATANATNNELAISGTANPPAGNYATDLFFSEYLEGGSNNKALEIFNGTGLPVDLSLYSVKLAANGNAWSTTLALTGMLNNDDVYVIANAGSNASILAVADITSTVTYYNGDDALGLFKEDVLIDVIGVPQESPVVKWNVAGVTNASENHTLIRKPTVVEGNTDWYASAGTTADNSEWIVQAQDYIDDLGLHSFAGDQPVTEAPVFDPLPGTFYSPINVSLSTATPGASIRYTTDGSIPTEVIGELYSTPIPVSATTTIKAVAYAPEYANSSLAAATYMFPVDVANIAELRAQAVGTTIYKLTGQAVLTFQQSTRNQKYIQDATAAILIDDNAGVITSTYNLYDGITGVTGTLGLYNGFLQFTPVADPGAATSTGNVIVPEERTLASLTTTDQARLVKVMSASLDASSGNFLATAQNITVTDASGSSVLRTFPATDYSGTAIPAVPVHITALVGQYIADMQISPRFLADFEIAGTEPVATKLVITAITPESPTEDTGFSVTIQSQDDDSIPVAVDQDTAIQISLATGTGILSGTLTGTILSGQNSVTINGVIYSIGEVGVSLTATATSGMTLTAGTSSTFTVQAIPISNALYYWNFNTNPPTSPATWTPPLISDIGSGQISYNFDSTTSFGGSTLNGETGEVTGGSLVPVAGTDLVNNGKYFEMTVPTTGYENIILSYATRGTGTGFSTQEVQYSLDGTNFTTLTTFTGTNVTAWSVRIADLTEVAGVANNANFKIRILVDGASSATGNNRFDNIKVNGDPVSGGQLDSPELSIERQGDMVHLSWNAITGAAQYRIEHSSQPYSGFGTLTTTTNNEYILPFNESMKFFRVIAEP